ncbi:MAG TPA: family 1 glycosylhydrolase [Candidatus Limnocylindrales bacterium]|nr:family 1 glycosylhydrolase [Candidatus Limnocylindrales bacterium]
MLKKDMGPSSSFLKFPEGFLFGTATSSFQVEGDSGERKSDWDIFLKKHTHIIKPGEVGPQWWKKGTAEADIDLAAGLGMQVQRLSLEWARIEPEKGRINKDALKRYHEIIDHLKENNIKPMVTLSHYTLPHWIARSGSWESSKIIDAFEKYTQVIVSEFGDVTEWITINEPGILVEAAYFVPFFPPQKFGLFAALRARSNMLEAHRLAYRVIKRNNPKARVSMAFAFRWYRPEQKNSYLEHKYAYLANHIDNLNYVDSVKDTLDFIGVNFYTGFYLNFNLIKFVKNVVAPHGAPPLLFGEVVKPGAYISDFFGPIVPDFFLNLLRVLHKRYSLPIYITENGVADRRDQYRPFYILTHLVALWKAQQEGISIQQYLVWSIIDNLEWLQGYRQEFGLIHVDPVTGQRTIRHSAEMYKEIIHSRGIDIKKLLDTYIPEEQKAEAEKLINHMLRG